MGLQFLKDAEKEEKTFAAILGGSVLIHLAVIVTNWSSFTYMFEANKAEWVFDAEIVSDFGNDDAISLPDAKEAERNVAPDTLLPQLPKNFSVKQKEVAKDEETFVDPEKDATKEEPKKAQEKPKEKKSQEDLKKDDESNPLDENEAKKRALIDSLKKEKLVKEIQTRQKEKLASLMQGGAGQSSAQANERADYARKVDQAIRKHYSLPDIQDLKNSNSSVTIEFFVNKRGNLLQYKIVDSSGHQSFDQLALNALKNAVPLPVPPIDLIGVKIQLRFAL